MANEEQPKLLVATTNELDLASFYLNETFSDIKFIIKGEEICAHKVILAARSKYFAPILLNNPDKSDLVLDTITPDTLKMFLQYIYTGSLKIDNNVDCIFELLKLVDSDKDLVKTLITTVSELLYVANVCDILNKADVFNVNELKEICYEFIEKHASDFLERDFVTTLTQPSIVGFLQRDTLSLPEMDVFNFAKKWCETNKDIDNLVVNCVRVSCLSKRDILNIVWPSKLIDGNILFATFADIEAGKIIIPFRIQQSNEDVSKIRDAFEMLELSPKEIMDSPDSLKFETIKSKLTAENVFFILNFANLYNLGKLKDICYDFMASVANDVILREDFYHLPKEVVVKLLGRDDFAAYEIDIVKVLLKWMDCNKTLDKSMLDCVRFSLLTIEEFVSIAWPSHLLNSGELLQILSNIKTGPTVKVCRNKIQPILFKCIVQGSHAEISLLSQSHNSNIIIVEFDRIFHFNNINMKFNEIKNKCYSYIIKTSNDLKNWTTVIDYSNFLCHTEQNLYFETQTGKYIKITETLASNKKLELRHFAVSGVQRCEVPEFVYNIVRPISHVATLDKAWVVEGYRPQALLDGNLQHKIENCTFHYLGNEHIVIHLAQPYLTSKIILLLLKGCNYSYYIETSCDKQNWQIAVDKRQGSYTDLQESSFTEREALFIRITGTKSFRNEYTKMSVDGFYCVHFACW